MQGVERFGRYELLHRLGQGGMAEVFLARLGDGDATKYLAIKRLLPNVSQRPRVVRRLANEARLTVWLTHPNIVQIFDFGRIDGLYYIAMEYVDGCDLRSVLRPRGKQAGRQEGCQLPIEVALDVGLQLCDALRYAHRCTDGEGQPLGIIHRDISPHNVLVSRDGHPKLADFGVARAAISDDLSRPGAVLGKLSYMPPEQAKGLPYDARVDLYACGATLYEMLAGARPFTNVTRSSATEERVPPPPSSFRPSIPPELDALVLRAMAPQADDRFADAEELSDAMSALLQNLGGQPKPHQLAGLVCEALEARERPSHSATQPNAKQGLAAGLFHSAAGNTPGDGQSARPDDLSASSSDRYDFEPADDSLIEPEITAVRSFLTPPAAVGQQHAGDWFRQRQRSQDHTGPRHHQHPNSAREPAAEPTVESVSLDEISVQSISAEPISLEEASMPAQPPPTAADPLAYAPSPIDASPTRTYELPPEPVLGRLISLTRTYSRAMLAGSVAVLLFLLGFAVGRCTSGDVTDRAPTVSPAPAPRSASPAHPESSLSAAHAAPIADARVAPSPDAAQSAEEKGGKDAGSDRALAAAASRHGAPESRPRGLDAAGERRLIRAARRAMLAGAYKRAMRLALRLLRHQRQHRVGLSLLGGAACAAGRRDYARSAARRLEGTRKRTLLRFCAQKGIELRGKRR